MRMACRKALELSLWNIVPWSLFSIIFVNSLLLRLSIPSAPFLDADSGGYLGPAINYYAGSSFDLIWSRSFPYPLFLAGVLKAFGSLSYITIVQHLINLGGLTLLFFVILRTRRLFRESFTNNLVSTASALVYAYLVFRTPSLIYFEHSVRPESIYPAVVATVIAAQLEFILAAVEGHRRRVLWLLPVLIILNIFSYLFRPNMGLAILLGPALAVAICLWLGIGIRKVAMAGAIGVSLALFTLILPDRYFGRNDTQRPLFLPLALVACHSNIILPLVKEDLRKLNFNRLNQSQMKLFYQALKAEVKSARRGFNPYPLLGVNPDSLMYSNQTMRKLLKSFETPQAFASVGYYYFLQMLSRRPGAYIRKLGKQLSLVYGLSAHPVYGEAELNLINQYRISLKVFRVDIRNKLYSTSDPTLLKSLRKQYGSELKLVFATVGQKSWKEESINQALFPSNQPQILSRAHNLFTWAFPFALIIWIGLFSICRCSGESTFKSDVGVTWLGLFTAYLYLYNFLHNFSIAAIGSLEVNRYILAQSTLVLLFLVLAGAFSLLTALGTVRIISVLLQNQRVKAFLNSRALVVPLFLAAGAIILYGLTLRLSVSAPVFIDADGGGYVVPAINYLVDGNFNLIYGRSFVYPAFLSVILKIFGSLEPIAVIQHVVALLGMAIVFFSVYRLSSIFTQQPLARLLVFISGLAYLFFSVISINSIMYEHYIRTESINVFFVALVVWSFVEVLLSAARADYRRLLILFPIVIFVNVVTYYFRPNVGFGILLAPALVVLILLGLKVRFLKIIGAGCLGVVVSYALIVLPNGYFGRKDESRITFLPLALVACHGNLILPVIKRELGSTKLDRMERKRLDLLYQVLAEQTKIGKAAGMNQPYPSLRINPDNIMYFNRNISELIDTFNSKEEFAQFLFSRFFRFLKARPNSYLKKLGTQLSFIYGPHSRQFIEDQSLNFYAMSTLSRSLAPGLFIRPSESWDALRAEYVASIDRSLALWDDDAWRNSPVNRNQLMFKLADIFSALHRTLVSLVCVIGVLLFLLSLFGSRLGTSDSCRAITWYGGFTIFLLGYNFLHSLSVGAVGTIEVARYVQAQFSTFLLFFVCGWTLCCLVVVKTCEVALALPGIRQRSNRNVDARFSIISDKPA